MKNYKNIWDKFSDIFGGTFIHPQYFIKLAERRTISEVVRLGSGKRIIDLGCGRQWYRPLTEKNALSYQALDHPKVSKKYLSPYQVDIKADIVDIPLKDNSVDLAFMIMVLEHLPDPERALEEIKRILIKDKGKLVICTVENYPGHDFPFNYYHYTKFGLEEILKRHGFKIQKIESFGNFWQTQATMRHVFLMHLVKQFPILLVLFAPLMILTNLLIAICFNQKSEEYALAHLVIASVKI